MSDKEQLSGIVDAHISALERLAATENTFLFVRPTEYDTTLLIKAGFATKSMDVHHKSSNWGPMAGFVPVDPAFNKKCDGKPNPQLKMPEKHGVASPVQLSVKEAFLNGLPKVTFQEGFTLVEAPKGGNPKGFPWVAMRTSGVNVQSAKKRFESFQTVGVPTHKFMIPNPAEMGNKSTLFCAIYRAGEYHMFYVTWEGDTGWLNPLLVFAYPQKGKLVPVTGDYDLWMVAPHFGHFDAHSVVALQKDKHGGSAASTYTKNLIPKMNTVCGREGNPVFNHGAESQNYGFTQALDWNLFMITPGGTSRMVRMNQMPTILADLQQAGYLVLWNKRYGENDPQLMHTVDKRANLGEIRTSMDQLFKALDEIKRTAQPQQVANQFAQSKQMPGAMKDELALMAKRFETSRTLGLEQSRIYRFHRLLLSFLDAQDITLRTLAASDFGSKFRTYSAEVKRLHGELQRLMVGATTGDGQSDDKLTGWLAQHKPSIDRLKQYWA